MKKAPALPEKRNLRRELKRYLPVYLLMLPGLIYLAVNNYAPMFGLVIAFKKMNFRKGIFGSEWVGLKNFQFLFQTEDAWIITRNTLLYNIAFILLGMVLALFVAILLSEVKNKLSLKVYQTSILLPHLISWVVIAYIVYALLSPDTGILNKRVLPAFGLDPVNWYTSKGYWPFILTFMHLWKGFGYSSIIYLSSILGISGEYYEAAMLDGATKWQQIKMITIPLLKSTMITLLILNTGRIFYSDFGLFYQIPMNSGPLYSVSNTIDTYVFRALLQLGDIGMSSAAGFYQSIVGFFMVVGANALVRRISAEDALF